MIHVRDRTNEIFLGCAAVFVFVLVFYLTPKMEIPTYRQVISLAFCIIILIVAVVMLVKGNASSFEIPIGVSAFVVSLYGLRIFFDFGKPDLRWVNVPVGATYDVAVIATVLFVGSFFLGYIILRPRLKLADIDVSASFSDLVIARRASWVLFFIGLIAVFATLIIAGGPMRYISNRGASEEISSIAAVQYSMMLGVVAAIIRIGVSFLQGNIDRRNDLKIGIAMAVPALAITLAEGSRRYALPLIIGVTVSWFLIRRKAIPVFRMAVVAMLGIVLVLLPLESVREGGSNAGGSFLSAAIKFGGDPMAHLKVCFLVNQLQCCQHLRWEYKMRKQLR